MLCGLAAVNSHGGFSEAVQHRFPTAAAHIASEFAATMELVEQETTMHGLIDVYTSLNSGTAQCGESMWWEQDMPAAPWTGGQAPSRPQTATPVAPPPGEGSGSPERSDRSGSPERRSPDSSSEGTPSTSDDEVPLY